MSSSTCRSSATPVRSIPASTGPAGARSVVQVALTPLVQLGAEEGRQLEGRLGADRARLPVLVGVTSSASWSPVAAGSPAAIVRCRCCSASRSRSKLRCSGLSRYAASSVSTVTADTTHPPVDGVVERLSVVGDDARVGSASARARAARSSAPSASRRADRGPGPRRRAPLPRGGVRRAVPSVCRIATGAVDALEPAGELAGLEVHRRALEPRGRRLLLLAEHLVDETVVQRPELERAEQLPHGRDVDVPVIRRSRGSASTSTSRRRRMICWLVRTCSSCSASIAGTFLPETSSRWA
jgi:hypothetical protein